MMESNESWERLWESLNKAASCCRELGKMTSVTAWTELSTQLLLLRKKAKVMYDAKPLDETQVQILVAQIEVAQKAAQGLA